MEKSRKIILFLILFSFGFLINSFLFNVNTASINNNLSNDSLYEVNYPNMDVIKYGDSLIYKYTVGDKVFTSNESDDDAWRKAMAWQYEQGLKSLQEIEFEYGLFTSREIVNIPYVETKSSKFMAQSNENTEEESGVQVNIEWISNYDDENKPICLPLKHMKVELWYVYYDSNNPITSIKLDEGYTDDNGDYTFTDIESWWELLHPFSEIHNMFNGVDLCVRVYPESTTFKVANDWSSIINFAGEALFNWQIVDGWLDALLSYNIVSTVISVPYFGRTGSFGTIQIPYGIPLSETNGNTSTNKLHRSFMVAQGLAMGQRFINDQGIYPTNKVFVNYPAFVGTEMDDNAFCYTDYNLGTGLMCIGSDRDDWEVLLHEYGHYVEGSQGFFPFHWSDYVKYFVGDLIGQNWGVYPVHSGYEDHISDITHGKGKEIGTKFAWSEGWAEAFSYIVQDYYWDGYFLEEKTLDYCKIDGVVRLASTSNYRILWSSSDSGSQYYNVNRLYKSIDDNSCEGQEKAITTFLINLYYDLPDGLSIFWNTSLTGAGTTDNVLNLSDFNNYIYEIYPSYSQQVADIMEKCQLAPSSLHVSGFDTHNPPTVSWYVSGSNLTPLDLIKIAFYDNDGTEKYVSRSFSISSAYNTIHTLDIPLDVWQEALVSVGNSSKMSIAIKGYSTKDTLSGPYISKRVTVDTPYFFTFIPLNQGNEYAVSGLTNPNNATSLIIPSTFLNKNVTQILHNAFKNQTMITQITIPNGVTNIGDNAFLNCTGLKSISFSDKLTIIGDGAFAGCLNLATIIGGINLEYVNKNAFISTKWLNDRYNSIVIIGKTLIHYGNYTNKEYTVPTGVKIIGQDAFDSSLLEVVYIPSNVNTISNGAFIDCENLRKVYLLSVTPPIVYSETFTNLDSLDIYVPQMSLDDYMRDLNYVNYYENIFTKKVNVYLYDENGFIYSTLLVDYYTLIDNFPTLTRVGYTFKGWYYSSNNKYYKNGRVFDQYTDTVSLFAQFEKDIYTLYLNYEDEFLNTITISYGEFKYFGIPEKEGGSFIGWFDKEGKQYTGSDGYSLFSWDKTNDKEILYAKFSLIEYRISYTLNLGINSSDNKTKYTVDDVIILYNPTRYGYIFDGWYLNNQKVTVIEKGTTGNINIEARWIGEVSYITASATLYSSAQILYLKNLSTNNSIKITVAPSVKQVTIISDSSAYVYKFYIEVSNRTDDLVFNLKNVSFLAPDGKDAIKADSGTYLLTINVEGNNNITGGAGLVENGVGQDGKNGITAYRLNIKGSGSVSVTGGKGVDGLNGTAGTNGDPGKNGPSGSFLNPIKGDNGKNGKNGTNGTNGGHGGYAIYTISTLSIRDCSYTLTGGNGGNGGHGGAGGAGGAGASDGSGNIFNGVGDAGDGGDGGDGGNGGNSGAGQYATNKNTVSGIKGENGTPGNGGAGGAGGAGGHPGDVGKAGENGTVGDSGQMGSIEVKYHAELDCETAALIENILVEANKSIFYEINVGCIGFYDIRTISVLGSTIKLYDQNRNQLSMGSITIYNGNILAYPCFTTKGIYYIELINTSIYPQYIDLEFDSRISTVREVTLDKKVDVLEHLHNNQNEFRFTAPKAGFYKIKLSATKDGQVIYNSGSITVYQGSNIVKKYENIEAISELNDNNIIFYSSRLLTYNILITFTDESVQTLKLSVEEISSIQLNTNDTFNNTTSIVYGDELNVLNVPRSGRYEFKINYSSSLVDGMPFYILKENENGSYSIVGKTNFSSNNNNYTLNLDINTGDKFYIGYFNGRGSGSITINVERIVLSTFHLYTDPTNNVVGTEVSINGGDYRGLRIMQGYTRVCYLEYNAPNMQSRLNYEWFSTNPSIATVSEFGTITAISPGNVRIIAVYRELNTIVGYIDIQVYEAPSAGLVYLQYGMDVRFSGTISGTEVTRGLGQPIAVGINPTVTIHRGYNRLICLGTDSPTASVQDFVWTSSNTIIASVSSYGTIVGESTGTVTIKGVYKYNNNYRVEITITVI